MLKKYSIGIDEVGRGPLAGPVSIGVVMMPRDYDLAEAFTGTGLTDSKKMSPGARERVHALATELQSQGHFTFGVYSVTAREIDAHGIEQALRSAIQTGLEKLSVDFREAEVLLDGRLKAPREFTQRSIIGGDLSELVISLASVVAKYERDTYMTHVAHKKYPVYGFDSHKGYGTEAHITAIKTHGVCPIHRRSFLRNIMVESRYE